MNEYRKDKKMRLSMCITFLLAIVASIGFSKPIFAQSNDQSGTSNSNAVVYIYRYKQFIGYTVEPSVYCNEVQLARMDNGRYFKVVLSPGTYIFRSNDKQSGIETELKNDEEYYIRVEIAQGLWKQYGRLVLMAKEQGAYEIKKLKPLSASKIKDRKRVAVDEQQQQQKQ
jgi:hypothetical protein